MEPIAVLRAYLDAGDAEDYDLFDTVMTPQVAVHTPGGRTSLGVAAQKQAWIAAHAGLTSLTHRVVHALCEGPHVAARLVASGVHTGPFLGIPPTGRRIEVDQALFARITGGRIEEMWEIVDTGSGLRQLGVLEGQALGLDEDATD